MGRESRLVSPQVDKISGQKLSEPTGFRVAVLTSTRFHMFDLARQLRLLGHDVSLLTGYPKWRLDPDLQDIAITHPYVVTPLVASYRFRVPLPGFLRWRLEHLARRDLSSWARQYLKGVKVLDALSSWGLEAGKFIQDNGGIHICNRGSTHMLHRKRMLEEEYRLWGIAPPVGFGTWNVDRELAEYEEADAIVVPAHFAKSTFVAQGIEENRIFVCPYGVELSLFAPRPKEDSRFRVIFVGSFAIGKGIGYLLEAVRPLVQGGHAELWLVGGPSPEAQDLLTRHRDLFIDKGFHPRRELSWFFSQADVMVLPSIDEGFGLVLAQAMACGVPVIASDHTGAKDLFTDGQEGFVVPVRDPGAIREKIQWLLDHPQARQEMAAAALQRVKQLGGWRTYGEKCSSMYAKLLSSRS